MKAVTPKNHFYFVLKNLMLYKINTNVREQKVIIISFHKMAFPFDAKLLVLLHKHSAFRIRHKKSRSHKQILK